MVGDAKVIPITADGVDESDSEKNSRWELATEVLLTAEFTRSGKVLEANASFLSCFGFELGEIRLQNHQIFAGTFGDSPNFSSSFWEALAEGEPQRGDFPFASRSGEALLMRGQYHPLRDESGNVVKVVLAGVDVTDLVTPTNEASPVPVAVVSETDPIAEIEAQTPLETTATPRDTPLLEPLQDWVGKQRQVLSAEVASIVASASAGTTAPTRSERDEAKLIQRAELALKLLQRTPGVLGLARLDHLSLSVLVEAGRLGESGRGITLLGSELRKVWEKASADSGKELERVCQELGRLAQELREKSPTENDKTSDPSVMTLIESVRALGDHCNDLWGELENRLRALGSADEGPQ